MSEEKARQQALQFQHDSAVLDVIASANSEGIRALMCTTHERMGAITAKILAEPGRFPEQFFYPCMPYAHKYANLMADKGVVGAIREVIPPGRGIDLLLRSGSMVARQDIDALMRTLVDIEMLPYKGAVAPVVFLQNVTVDLLVGIGMQGILRAFAEYVQSQYGAEPGFITMNLPQTLAALSRDGVERPIVCASINKIGFRMSGGVEGYEDSLRNFEFRAMAMSVLASGAIGAHEALSWVCGLPNVESIVFGASSQRNNAATRALVDEFWVNS